MRDTGSTLKSKLLKKAALLQSAVKTYNSGNKSQAKQGPPALKEFGGSLESYGSIIVKVDDPFSTVNLDENEDRNIMDFVVDGYIPVSAIVVRCIQFLHKHALKEEGIYRISGSMSLVAVVKSWFVDEPTTDLIAKENFDLSPYLAGQGFNEFGQINLGSTDISEPSGSLSGRYLDGPIVASVLKGFIRELTPPIGERLDDPFYWGTLLFLMRHLRTVGDSSSVNRMTQDNIGLVWIVNLGVTKEQFNELYENCSDYSYLKWNTDDISNKFNGNFGSLSTISCYSKQTSQTDIVNLSTRNVDESTGISNSKMFQSQGSLLANELSTDSSPIDNRPPQDSGTSNDRVIPINAAKEALPSYLINNSSTQTLACEHSEDPFSDSKQSLISLEPDHLQDIPSNKVIVNERKSSIAAMSKNSSIASLNAQKNILQKGHSQDTSLYQQPASVDDVSITRDRETSISSGAPLPPPRTANYRRTKQLPNTPSHVSQSSQSSISNLPPNVSTKQPFDDLISNSTISETFETHSSTASKSNIYPSASNNGHNIPSSFMRIDNYKSKSNLDIAQESNSIHNPFSSTSNIACTTENDNTRNISTACLTNVNNAYGSQNNIHNPFTSSTNVSPVAQYISESRQELSRRGSSDSNSINSPKVGGISSSKVLSPTAASITSDISSPSSSKFSLSKPSKLIGILSGKGSQQQLQQQQQQEEQEQRIAEERKQMFRQLSQGSDTFLPNKRTSTLQIGLFSSIGGDFLDPDREFDLLKMKLSEEPDDDEIEEKTELRHSPFTEGSDSLI